MPATGWKNHDAAAYVARAEHIPAAERHELLDMLGLLTDTGLAVEPDPEVADRRTSESATATIASIHGDCTDAAIPTSGRFARRYEGPSLNGRLCPPGLRALFEGHPPVQDSKPEPPPPPPGTTPAPKPRQTRKTGTPGVGSGNGRPEKPINHGSPHGSRQHRRRGEEPCEECLEGRRRADRESKRRNYKPKPPRKIAACGTPAGRERHRRLKEKTCDACKAARTEARRAARAA